MGSKKYSQSQVEVKEYHEIVQTPEGNSTDRRRKMPLG
jgi:hypothetical protein